MRNCVFLGDSFQRESIRESEGGPLPPPVMMRLYFEGSCASPGGGEGRILSKTDVT